ncbi:hypothetical protein MNBD_PLANCTO02-1132 [hydrothermal vent metagenome]|uniref:ATP-grasp domain-containing protein n=1 Tax=hydrothermal vent metagenome TaxID=652676 RepID=A0A3B1E8L3_9ZZZZ
MIASTSQNSHPKQVLVLGHDVRMVLPIVRSLGQRGIITDLGWCPDDSPAVHSRYVRYNHQIPSPDLEDDSWIDILRALIREHRYQLVIPASESIVYFLQSERAAFEEFKSVYLLNDAVFQTAFDKTKCGDLADSLQIPIPQSQICKNTEELNSFLKTVSYPLIIKPDCSVNLNNADKKNFVLTASSAADAKQLFQQMISSCSQIQMQETVSGIGVGLEFLANQGELLVVHQHQRIHETSGHGSTYRSSVPVDSRFHEATAKIVKQLNYTGVGMAEFRVDYETQEWWFLELNARFWGSLPLAVAAGVDFPRYLFEMLVENRTQFDSRYQSGVRCRNIRNDLRWNRHWFLQFCNSQAVASAQKQGWKTNSISLKQYALDWLRMMTFRDYHDVFSIDDRAPAWCEARQIFKSFCRNLISKKELKQSKDKNCPQMILDVLPDYSSSSEGLVIEKQLFCEPHVNEI